MSGQSSLQSLRRWSGIALSGGVAVGRAYRVTPEGPVFYRLAIQPHEVEAELGRFEQARRESRSQLQSVREQFEERLGRDQAFIIEAHLLILEDPSFLERIRSRIADRLESPERAVRETGEDWLEVYRSVGDPFFREKGSDMEEVVDRITANLLKLESAGSSRLPDPILVVEKPQVSMLADVGLSKVRGLVASDGGRASHVTIIARSARIPMVAGIESLGQKIHTGDLLIVDGDEGVVYADPEPELIERYRSRSSARTMPSATLPDSGPALTSDGVRVRIYVNAELEVEVREGIEAGAEGVGLYRSEFLFMTCKTGPVEEDEQLRAYRGLVESLDGRPAFVRTVDLGDEGHPYFARLAGEDEPLLGLRGIRLGAAYPEIFKSQLRAILRASRLGPLKIVLPMITSAQELQWGRAMLREAAREVSRQGAELETLPELGAMLEVPAAVLEVEAIARHSDFLLVGTNDLIQYTLAVGRSNQRVAHLFDPYHPAILRSLQHVARVAMQSELPALVCGEVAADPLYSRILVGMGFRHLSMNAAAIPVLRRSVRECDTSSVAQVVERLLAESDGSSLRERAAELLGP